MSKAGNELQVMEAKLRPHQRAFVDACFNPSNHRVIELQANYGFGKSKALSVVAERYLIQQKNSRILFLSPVALVSGFLDTLMRSNVNAVILDRYKFRELLDSSGGHNIWPNGTVFVASLDFVNVPDIRDSLTSIAWDLIIVDESHNLTGSRAKSVEKFGTSAGRVILSTVPSSDSPHIFASEEFTKIIWQREDIVGSNVNGINVATRPILNEVIFNFSLTEIGLLESGLRFISLINGDNLTSKLAPEYFRRSFESSPLALEQFLRELYVEFSGKRKKYFETEEIFENRLMANNDTIVYPKLQEVLNVIRDLLRDIENVGEDSKLDAFSNLLLKLTNSRDRPARICVITNYLSTLYYLAADVEDKGMACYLIHDGVKVEEREEMFLQIKNKPGILLATRSMMISGFDLPEFSDLIIYDFHSLKYSLELILARFNGFGRSKSIQIYAIKPSNPGNYLADESFKHLRELTS